MIGDSTKKSPCFCTHVLLRLSIIVSVSYTHLAYIEIELQHHPVRHLSEEKRQITYGLVLQLDFDVGKRDDGKMCIRDRTGTIRTTERGTDNVKEEGGTYYHP